MTENSHQCEQVWGEPDKLPANVGMMAKERCLTVQKESRRVKMTKMLLNESFLKFLAEKPLPRITIKEICEDADVNRSTYYAHFTDRFFNFKL